MTRSSENVPVDSDAVHTYRRCSTATSTSQGLSVPFFFGSFFSFFIVPPV